MSLVHKKTSNIGSYKFYSGNMSFKGAFNIYQAKNGSIVLVLGTSHTNLSEKQIKDLSIDVYSLKDFEYDDYIKFYKS